MAVVVVALQPPPDIASGSTFVVLAFFLGLGTGGVFAWAARQAPADRVGSITGVVGAMGGLGGFFPPLVMGTTYQPGVPRVRPRLGIAEPARRGRPHLHAVHQGRTGVYLEAIALSPASS